MIQQCPAKLVKKEIVACDVEVLQTFSTGELLNLEGEPLDRPAGAEGPQGPVGPPGPPGPVIRQYGELGILENTIPTTIDQVDTFVPIAGVVNTGLVSDFEVLSPAAFRYVGNKHVLAKVCGSWSWRLGETGSSSLCTFNAGLNETILNNTQVTAALDDLSQNTRNAAVTFLVSLQPGDEIRFFLRNTVNTNDILILNMQMVVSVCCCRPP